jgi:AcrR family transcriptional regulator
MPRSSREKSAETRANIIETAYQLFLEHGYSAASMRMISQQAGVTVGAIYNHFSTKEEIWKEVILTKHPYHEILPLLVSAEGDSVAEAVRSAARVMVQELFKRPELFNLMFIEIVEFQAKHAADLLQEIFPRLGELQRMFFEKQGKLRNIPAPVLLRSFTGLFMSYYITGIFARNFEGMATDESTLDQFVDLYLYGILEESDTPVESST